MTVDVLWRRLPIREVEVSLAKVLRCGQTFRWKNINNVWSFAIEDRIVFLKQDEESIQYSHLLSEKVAEQKPQAAAEKETLEFVKDYFNLSVNLVELYDHWSSKHEPFKKSTKGSLTPFNSFQGIRILRQDPWETVVSFICSSNNNVKRISKMCDSLCTEFGEYINEHEGIEYYSFPSADILSKSSKVETRLRELGFGYRAKYIYETAKKFTDSKSNPDITIENLNNLRNAEYEEAHEFLLQLTGVGPKVADCICLMALDKHDVVPVDTHVYQIAVRDYKFKGKKDMKTMNKATYESIRVFFKELFGPYAGWAQSVLFASDLGDLNNGTNRLDEKTIIKKEEKETQITQVGGKKKRKAKITVTEIAIKRVKEED
ncbi:8-oxoguanine DNA glycosylase [Scheffersomyces xylosifermentans]|uniref:8-oxoguanine DNA glycosylase n=1 Tax=Scheffersomyces xylosifermentans TaxID=1304137 RepID=UPI00315D588A